jgi:hypothetical protein
VTLRTIPPRDWTINEYHFLNHTGFILIAVTYIQPKHNLLDIRLETSFFNVLYSFYRFSLKPSTYMKKLLTTCHTSRITAMGEVNGSNENRTQPIIFQAKLEYARPQSAIFY